MQILTKPGDLMTDLRYVIARYHKGGAGLFFLRQQGPLYEQTSFQILYKYCAYIEYQLY